MFVASVVFRKSLPWLPRHARSYNSPARVLHDTVWGTIALPPFLWTIVDTAHFQRLRYLRQNGLLHLVFDGAVHTRFAHSIGTAWLACKLVRRLQAQAPSTDVISDAEVNTVAVAALCHDLGHGPCSHSYDLFMGLIDETWTHEVQTVAMLQHLVKTNAGVQLALDSAGVDVHAVCEIILGSKQNAPKQWVWQGPWPGRAFLFEIVSCSSTGIDVDKWDYLRRDSHYLDIPHAFVSKRLLNACRVANGHLTWPASEASTVMDMFHARFQLHDRAYQHRVCRLVQRMVMHALFLMKDYEVGGAT